MQRYWCCISTTLCDTVVHFTFAASVLLLLHLLVLLTSLCTYEYSLPPVVLITGLTGVTGISCRLMPDNRRSVATARPVTDNRHFIPVHNTNYDEWTQTYDLSHECNIRFFYTAQFMLCFRSSASMNESLFALQLFMLVCLSSISEFKLLI
jgi:hypothetical protein